MSCVLITGWCGTEFGMMAASTMPLMERYASKHWMKFACVNLLHPDVPASWIKIPYLIDALDRHDAAVWVDADVVISQSDASILDAVPGDSLQGMVEHKTECGLVPNCGVWVVRKSMQETLKAVWREDLPKYKDHPWWEQAAVISRMGYELGDGPTASPVVDSELRRKTCYLMSEWNDHPHDARRCPRPRFIHVTQYCDRVEAVRSLCAEAT